MCCSSIIRWGAGSGVDHGRIGDNFRGPMGPEFPNHPKTNKYSTNYASIRAVADVTD